MSTCIIHIGLPKTASTYLQHNVFPNCKETFFINEAQHARKRLGKNYTEYEYLIDSIKQDEDYYFNEEKLESLSNNLGTINSIISSESLSIEGQVDRITKARRLKKLTKNFKKVKILFFIREQTKLLESMYFQWLKGAGKKYPYMDFLMWFNSQKDGYNSIIKRLMYHDIIEMYSKVFGKENIEIMLYEDFKKRNRFIEKRIQNLLGVNIDFKNIDTVDPNPRIPNYQIFLLQIFGNSILKFLRKIVPKFIKNIIRKTFKSKPKLNVKDYLDETDIKIISENNLKLSKEYQLDLKEYGYF